MSGMNQSIIKYSLIVTICATVLGVLNYTYIPYKLNEKATELNKLNKEKEGFKKSITKLKTENDTLKEKVRSYNEEKQTLLNELETYQNIALDQIAMSRNEKEIEELGVDSTSASKLEVRKKRIEIESLLVDPNMDGATNGVTILLKYSSDRSVEAEALKIILRNLNMEVHLLETEKVDKTQRGIIKWKISDSAMFAKTSLSKMLRKFTGTKQTKVDNSLSTMLEISL